VNGVQKIVEHGPDAQRYNVVLLGDGYRATEMAKYHADVQAFVDMLHQTAPFGDLWCGINIHRIDVVSTDSGADDPVTCGDGSAGSGAIARTYFDATFCGGNLIRRLLTCDSVSARNVAHALVPATHLTMVIVNSPLYGGSGGDVATFSTAAGSAEIALHEMGHTAFGFADEYEYYAGCASGESGHDVYTGGEPVEPNVTRNADLASISGDRCCRRRRTRCRRLPTLIAANAIRRRIRARRIMSAPTKGRATCIAGAIGRRTSAGCARWANRSAARAGRRYATRWRRSCPSHTKASGGTFRRARNRAGE